MTIGRLVFVPWYPVIYTKLWVIGRCTGDEDMEYYAVRGMLRLLRKVTWRRAE